MQHVDPIRSPGADRSPGRCLRGVAALVVAMQAACGLADPEAESVDEIIIVGADHQSGLADEWLGGFFGVRVQAGGRPLAGARVKWELVMGSGEPSTDSFTDDSGFTVGWARLGPPGRYRLRASAGRHSVTFDAEGFSNMADRVVLETSLPFPPNYGVHDTFVRDGLLVVCAWNSGLFVYDIGGGFRGGTPTAPVLVTQFIPSDAGVPGGPQVHNAWWLRDRATGALRYLFVGQEGPRVQGDRSSGDIHLIDLDNLASPREIGTFRLPGAGTHNFWIDENKAVLYAAYYNGGVVALDVSGTLIGGLSDRLLAQSTPGGPGNTWVWAVQLREGALWAIDTFSGLWRLDPASLQPIAGGLNIPDYFSTELWVGRNSIWTGTRGSRGTRPNGSPATVLVWDPRSGTPIRVGSVATAAFGITDLQAADDDRTLFVSTEAGVSPGIHVFRVDPLTRSHHPLAFLRVNDGIHTATLANVSGRALLFAAKNPPNPALLIYDVTDLTSP